MYAHYIDYFLSFFVLYSGKGRGVMPLYIFLLCLFLPHVAYASYTITAEPLYPEKFGDFETKQVESEPLNSERVLAQYKYFKVPVCEKPSCEKDNPRKSFEKQVRKLSASGLKKKVKRIKAKKKPLWKVRYLGSKPLLKKSKKRNRKA